MAQIPAARTSLARSEIAGTFEAVRAEALFASTLRPATTDFRELIVASEVELRALSEEQNPLTERPSR